MRDFTKQYLHLNSSAVYTSSPKNQRGLLYLNPLSAVQETEMIPLYHKDTGNREDP